MASTPKYLNFFKVNNGYSALLSQSYAAYDLAAVHQELKYASEEGRQC